MVKRYLVLGGALASALALGVAAAGSASAGVSGTVLADSNGTSGYYTQSFGGIYNQIDATYTLNDASIPTNEFAGGTGVELCNSSTGQAVELGTVYAGGGEFVAAYAHGTLHGDPTGDGDPCTGNHLLFGGALTTSTGTHEFPAGDSVEVQIQQVGGVVTFTVEDVTQNVASFTRVVHLPNGYYNDAGAGVSTDLQLVAPPPSQDLTDFSGVTATTTTGDTDGFASWNAVQVNAELGPTIYMEPSAISPTGPKTCTTVKGHWSKYKHHKRHWIKKKTTCSGGGPSSFSVLGSQPIA
jgi:hypothetical protein